MSDAAEFFTNSEIASLLLHRMLKRDGIESSHNSLLITQARPTKYFRVHRVYAVCTLQILESYFTYGKQLFPQTFLSAKSLAVSCPLGDTTLRKVSQPLRLQSVQPLAS